MFFLPTFAFPIFSFSTFAFHPRIVRYNFSLHKRLEENYEESFKYDVCFKILKKKKRHLLIVIVIIIAVKGKRRLILIIIIISEKKEREKTKRARPKKIPDNFVYNLTFRSMFNDLDFTRKSLEDRKLAIKEWCEESLRKKAGEKRVTNQFKINVVSKRYFGRI